MKAFLLVAAAAGFGLCQECPALQVELYNENDQTCDGGSTTVTIGNSTCFASDSYFGSVRQGSLNDPAWDTHCIVFVINSPCTSSELTAGFLVNSTAEDSCINATSSNSGTGHGFLMYCALQGGPDDCLGPPGPGGGGPVTTSSTIVTTPITTQNTTPSPTNTKASNPYVSSAVSSASSAVDRASSSVSAYQANPTNSALAQAAEDEIENAMAVNQEASDIALDFQASSVIAHLSDIDSALAAAAEAAVIAEAAPEAAAAASVAEAFGPAIAAVAAAVAAAADPEQDPAPDTTTPRTTPTTSAGPCTINVEAADARLAEPSPMYTDLEGGTATSITDPATVQARDVAPETSIPAVPDAIKTSLASVQKRDGAGRGMFCNGQFDVPFYQGYSSTGGNPYGPFYNYYSSSACGDWNFGLVSASSDALLPGRPALQSYPSHDYATEHIYEIQSVDIFLAYARDNEPTFQQLYNGNGAAFCRGFGSLLYSKVQFAATGLYDYSTSPGEQIYGALEGGTGDNSEFVYLEARTNNRKGVIFGLGSPSLQTSYEAQLAAVSRTAVITAYLQNPNIAGIYRTVSDRVRAQFIAFGQACNASSFTGWNRFGGIDWATLYDQWESGYLDAIQAELVADASQGVAQALAGIRVQLARGTTPLVEKQRLEKLKAHIAVVRDRDLTPADLSLAGLRRPAP